MSSDNNSARRVVMSKRVARQFLEDEAGLARSVTVFFSRDATCRELLSRVSHFEIPYTQHFDHVNFMADRKAEVRAIRRASERLGLEYDAV